MDISELICEIKKDKEKFILLLRRFQPLIRKYVKILYKDEEEDMYADFASSTSKTFTGLTAGNDCQL